MFPKTDGIWFAGQEIADSERPNFLVGRVIPMRGVGILVGAPGVGKTLLCLDMACSIATGRLYLTTYFPASAEWPSNPRRIESGATLFIAGEGRDTFPDRIEAAHRELEEKYSLRLFDLDLDHLPIGIMRGLNLIEDNSFQEVFEKVKIAKQIFDNSRAPLRLVVIDTLSSVFGFIDENNAAIAQNAMNKMNTIAEELGVFVLATHHPRKKSGGELRGSGNFEAAADIVLSAERHLRGRRKSRSLRVKKSRYQEDEIEGIEFHISKCSWKEDAQWRSAPYIGGSASLSSDSEGSDLSPQEPQLPSKRFSRDARFFALAIHRTYLDFVKRTKQPKSDFTKDQIKPFFEPMLPLEDNEKAHSHKARVRKAFQRGEKASIVYGLVEMHYVNDATSFYLKTGALEKLGLQTHDSI